ncbi:aminomethyltransferase family protein [Amycolatopsis pithecellobii]|uniref:Aminomethyl transferase family protein n=1 Tax=Amycolatopsis pithecellobii TaxID=664692 RepID=A0A6N7ZBK6_9PSEU|nr:aminomethyltransferase family protein [Amycolatopsis pithecellobii]MTD59123.1 aminomethyl transferase family protein [Amycolatopsis pithecellobii]
MPEASTEQSLQDLIDGLPSLVEYFSHDTRAPSFKSAGAAAAALTPPAYSNWRDEQRAWSETAVLFQQTHNMPELFLEGPDALRLLERLGVNTFANFTTDRAKQFVTCTPNGHIIGDSIVYRHGEQSFELVSGMPGLDWVHYHAETGGYDVKVVRDNQSTDNPSGRRVRFRFQLDGPHAGAIFAAAVDGEPPAIPFFRTATVSIAGKQVLVLRHGMAGYKGVELSGAFEDHDEVRAALITAGAGYGLVPAGTQAYYSTPMSSGWMPYPVPGIFTGQELRGFREWLPSTSWEARIQLAGSFRSPDIEDYYATPYDLGYERMVKFDHDFIGREALEKIRPEDRRTKRTLVWNRDDVVRVFASQFGDGPRYKAIELPVSHYGWNQFDVVRNASGRQAGVSCHAGYNDGRLLSLAMLDLGNAEIGTELVLTWGEPDGGSRKPQVEKHEQTEIRVVVAPAPFTGTVQRMRRADLDDKA